MTLAFGTGGTKQWLSLEKVAIEKPTAGGSLLVGRLRTLEGSEFRVERFHGFHAWKPRKYSMHYSPTPSHPFSGILSKSRPSIPMTDSVTLQLPLRGLFLA